MCKRELWTITSEQLQLGVILEDLKWDLTAHVELEENDDENLHDLAVVHHLLALNIMKQENRPPTEPPSCGMEGHVCGIDHCLNTLSEQHCQLDKLYGRLSRSDKSEMELIADCQGVTEVNLKPQWIFTEWSARSSHWNAWSVPMNWSHHLR